MYFRPSPKSTPSACCGKNGVIGLWIICYATIAKMPKTTRLPEAKVWIGSPIIGSECRGVRRIFEQTVTYREWQEPLMYADDEPYTMWAWNPLSKNSHH